MEFVIALILGVVQGLTEFLPVSSTGHLVFLERLTGFQLPVLTFHVFLHAGTMFALIFTLRRELTRVLKETGGIIIDGFRNLVIFIGVLKGEDVRCMKILRSNYRKVAAIVMLSSAASFMIAYLFRTAAAASAESLLFTGVGALITGIVLTVTEKVRPGSEIPKDVPLMRTVLIGIAGGTAVLSGISAVAVMMCTGIFLGFNRKNALRLTWLILITTDLAALIFEVSVSIRTGVFSGNLPALCLTGMAASALTGIFFFGKARQLIRMISFGRFAKYSYWFGAAAVLLGILIK